MRLNTTARRATYVVALLAYDHAMTAEDIDFATSIWDRLVRPAARKLPVKVRGRLDDENPPS